MSRRQVLRIMILGFTLVVLLVAAAAYIGYVGSQSIQRNAQEMVRENLQLSDRAASLERKIEQESEQLLGELIWILGACCLMELVFSVVTISMTNQAFRKMEWQTEELTRVSWHMLESQELIARRFSHEMHDELGQALTGLKGMLKRMDGPEFERRRSECVQILEEVLTSVRELSQLLRPIILDDFGLDAGLRWLINRFTQRTQIEVGYTSNFSERMSEDLETHVFRIAQEALTNVARHSGASKASMTLNAHGGRISLIVDDNGCGIHEGERHTQPSLGMVGMRARARQVDGELNIRNHESGGLRIHFEAPLRRAADEQEDAHPVGG